MADRQDDQEVELKAIEDKLEEDNFSNQKVSFCEGHREEEKGWKFRFHPSFDHPIRQFFADVIIVEKRGVVEELKHKTCKTNVPFYYENKTFLVSTSYGFVKQIEKEHWKSFMSFVKATFATRELLVEASTVPQLVKAGFDHQEGKVAQGALALVQDLRPDMVVEVPTLSQDIRPYVVE